MRQEGSNEIKGIKIIDQLDTTLIYGILIILCVDVSHSHNARDEESYPNGL